MTGIDFEPCFGKQLQRVEQRTTSWNPHNVEKFILDVDGSSLGNPGYAGFSWVIRNSSG